MVAWNSLLLAVVCVTPLLLAVFRDGRLARIRGCVVCALAAIPIASLAPTSAYAAPELSPSGLLAKVDSAQPNLSGVVKSADGKPVEGALVYIYSAGVRVGTSPYCPTCYLDCGKRAATNAEGAFSIEKLDPTLVFRVLVVAKGYEPQFVSKVDPAKGEPLSVAMKARPATPEDRSRVVSGTVLSPNNTPIAGALVEPFGCKTAQRRWWGSMPGVDPLAVSDENGNFEIVTAEPVEALDLQVSARAMATKKFALLSSGNAQHSLQLTTGATVRGRLLENGKPLSGVLMGLVQADRSSDEFLGPTQIGTDANGQFLFTNVPPDREYFVYGLMDSLQKHGAVKARVVNVAGDNSTSEVGDLNTEPAFRIAGRIALSDGKPVPPNTRILFSRDDAWDSQNVEADSDGKFEVAGIPQGVISITARVPDYHTSEKNKSLERLNGTSLKGLVTADIDELTILLEPGKHEWRDWSKNRDEWNAVVRTLKALDREPPIGVTADLQQVADFQPDVIAVPLAKPVKELPKIDVPPARPALPAADADVPKRTVNGRVIDHDGKPVADADVLLPVRWVTAATYLTAQGKSAPDGTFELQFPDAWIPDDVTRINSTVWAYAPGHSIGTAGAHQQVRGSQSAEQCEIKLGPPTETKFSVLLPDGQPAAGLQVKPTHFLTRAAYAYVPRDLVTLTAATTDDKGLAAFPAYPLDKLHNVDVISEQLGTQQFRVGEPTVGPQIALQLQNVGRIEGRVLANQPALFGDMVVHIETESSPSRMSGCTGQAIVSVEPDGSFVVPHIAPGMVSILALSDDRLPVRPRLPESNELEVLAGKTTRIEIPLEMAVEVHGSIRIKGSEKSVSGATIYVGYGVGRQSEHATSDAEGRFRARVLPGKVRLQVIHAPNVDATQMSDSRSQQIDVPEGATNFELPPIELTKTKTLSGRLLDSDGKPLPQRRILGVVGNRRYGFGESDQNGDFKMTGVPEDLTPDKFEIIPDGNGPSPKTVVDSTDPLVIRVE